MASIPIQIYQDGDIEDAGKFLHGHRARGLIAAAFLYHKKTDPNRAESVGTLYVGIPETHGLTQGGHAEIKDRFHIAVFEQRNQVAVAIADTEIEAASEMIVSAIKPY